MRASTTYLDGGSKATKIAIITALHVGVGLALINMKMTTPPVPPVILEPYTPPATPPTPPEIVEVDTTTKKLEPTIFVPEPVVLPTTPPPPDTVIAKVLPPGPPPVIVADAGKNTGIIEGPAKTIAKKESVYTPTLVNAGDCARPDYPASSVRNGDSGTVTLALLIGADGKVADYKIKNTSGFKELDRAAVSALRMCKFKPAMTNGVAEPAWGQLAYVWSLD